MPSSIRNRICSSDKRRHLPFLIGNYRASEAPICSLEVFLLYTVYVDSISRLTRIELGRNSKFLVRIIA